MKEILKYLRTVNSYSQQDVAEAIGLSRQSYNKYESGSVIPSDKIVDKLADFYKVKIDFIKRNKLPDIPGRTDISAPEISAIEKKDLYSSRSASYVVKAVASSAPAYCATAVADSNLITETKKPEQLKTYDAYYSKGRIILSNNDLDLEEGQRLKIAIRPESEEEELARRKKAWEMLKSYIGSFEFTDEDKDYDTLRWEALQEKYGPF